MVNVPYFVELSMGLIKCVVYVPVLPWAADLPVFPLAGISENGQTGLSVPHKKSRLGAGFAQVWVH